METVDMKIELKPENMPVSKEMLDHATLSLKSDIKKVEQSLRSEIHEVKAEIHEVKAEVHGFKAEMSEFRSEMHGMKSDIHETKLMVEEQRNENKIIYDHLNMMYDRQTSFEEKTTNNFLELKNLILAINS